MSRAPTDPEKLAAVIAELELERRRREDERIAAGTATRLPLSVVVSPGAEEAKVIKQAKAAKLAALRAEGFSGEVYFEPELIFTGVPRNDDFGKWEHKLFEPQYPTRYATTTIRPRKGDDDIVGVPNSAPSEWKSIRVQVVAPNEDCGHPGTVIEGEYAAVGSEVQVRYEGRVYATPYKAGDNAEIVAKRLLREKYGKHGAFHDPIHYPPRSYH